MKSIFNLFLTTVILLSLASCGGRNGKSLDQMSDPSAADSLLYFFGQVKADQYWQEACNDSAKNSPAARAAYLKGVRTALKLIGDDESFNDGVIAGIRMASNIRTFSREFNIALDPDVLYNSIAYGMESSPGTDNDTVAEEFYRLLSRIRNSSDIETQNKATAALSAAAKDRNMSPLDSDNLLKRIISEGYGNHLTNGSTVRADISISKDGYDLGIPLPRDIKIGAKHIIPVISQALCSMKEGEKAIFLTTANNLFGRRCTQMHLRPDDIVTVEISLGQQTAGSNLKADKPAYDFENDATPF
ncbi:MAG: hypothetical protein HDS82_06325 [Bacteroidales bacterium]|nr:hypothetical protein [Bacteroidales bacterium]MBD5204466.1 hypothetical protein [Bacteroidales bacterium]